MSSETDMIFASVEAKSKCDFNILNVNAKFHVKNYNILNPKVGRALNPPVGEVCYQRSRNTPKLPLP